MRFDELNEDNYMMFAIKHYENPHAVTQDDFYDDLKRFKWIKRLLKRYQTTGTLKSHLLINHFIILYNVFGEAATPLLFLKTDRDLWPVLKTFIVYLGRLPEFPKSELHSIPTDDNCLQDLNKI